jgi:hypothetical protein
MTVRMNLPNRLDQQTVLGNFVGMLAISEYRNRLRAKRGQESSLIESHVSNVIICIWLHSTLKLVLVCAGITARSAPVDLLYFLIHSINLVRETIQEIRSRYRLTYHRCLSSEKLEFVVFLMQKFRNIFLFIREPSQV